MTVFHSEVLNRTLESNEIQDLNDEDLGALMDELMGVIRAIHKSLKEIEEFEEKHQLPPDEEWKHRAKKQLRICTHFAAQVEATGRRSATDAPAPAPDKALLYSTAYIKHLHDILVEEIDPQSLEKIEQEAAELARLDVERRG